MELIESVVFRRAVPADSELVHRLTREIWTGRVSPESTVFRETPETVAAQISRGGGVIAKSGDVAIGCGRWVPVAGPGGQGRWIEIKRIGVIEAWRKRGIGVRILAELESAGREIGAEGAHLAVRHDQPRLLAVYEMAGYVVADDVEITTPNPRSPPPVGMRKRFGG